MFNQCRNLSIRPFSKSDRLGKLTEYFRSNFQFIEVKLRHENETSASLTKSLMNGLSQGRPNSGEDDVRKRLNNLIGLTLNTVDNDMKAALKNSLKEFNITYDE